MYTITGRQDPSYSQAALARPSSLVVRLPTYSTEEIGLPQAYNALRVTRRDTTYVESEMVAEELSAFSSCVRITHP